MKSKLNGFTLIEVLIALAIISIAFTAIILATMQNIRNTQYVENKMTADWVGMEVMNKIQAKMLIAPQDMPLEDNTIFLGKKWFWKASLQATPNPKIMKILVDVATTEKSKRIINLVSYKYNETPAQP